MPAAVAVPLVTGAMAAGATAYGAHAAGKSSSKAAQLNAQSTAAALDEQRRQEAERKAEFEATQAENKRQWDADQQFQAQKFAAEEEQRLHDRALADATEARRAPYRAASQAALGRLGDILGIKFDSSMPAVATAPAGSPTAAGAVPTSQGKTLGSMIGVSNPMTPPSAQPATASNYDPVNDPNSMASLLGMKQKPYYTTLATR